jgi:acetylornithine deacetylase
MKLLSFPSLLLLVNWVYAINPSAQQKPLVDNSKTYTSSLLDLHKALIVHESITNNEDGVAQWLVSYLKKQNFTVETQEISPATSSEKARHNVFAYVGRQRETRTLITSHIDTVPPFWPYDRRGDEIWGRGSVDAKGSVATQITAVQELLTAGELTEGDIALLFVVGEEDNGIGMRKANGLGLKWDTVIFGEPTGLKLASGHKGVMGLEIRAKGKAGHSGYPELGKSANSMLIRALNAFLSVELPWNEKYGNTTLNIGRMEGGVAGNVIPEDASAKVTLRIADGTPEEVQKILLEAIRKTGETLDVDFHLGYGPVYIDSDVEGKTVLRIPSFEVANDSTGFETVVVNYGTDIPNLKGDHKRYLYGPGSILVAHSDHEHLKIADLEAAVEGYTKLIKHSLKQ